ncbi:MAG TPA: response regulator [Euzebyales bacterium]|nr:response regulator [Euzebyales bacterium]
MVIEDERAIATAIADHLRSEGFDVGVALDGHEGVRRRAADRHDLVVLDLMLPDGLEVCRRIQQDLHVPVLMLTAHDDETDMLVELGVGADDYMTKPFSPRELWQGSGPSSDAPPARAPDRSSGRLRSGSTEPHGGCGGRTARHS